MGIFGTSKRELKETIGYYETVVKNLTEDFESYRAALNDAKSRIRQLESENERQAALNNLTKDIRVWADHNWPLRAQKDPLCSAVEELGELMRAQTKGEQGIRATPEDWEKEAQKEWGDVLISLLDYASIRNWNPLATLLQRWTEVKKRDWVKFKQDGLTR